MWKNRHNISSVSRPMKHGLIIEPPGRTVPRESLSAPIGPRETRKKRGTPPEVLSFGW